MPSRWLPIRASAPEKAAGPANELAYVDQEGVIRWTADHSEVALFGANYTLPSSCDYRAAGYLGSDRKKLVEKDMAHFARMGWDGLRLCLWGDWENCDRKGNLIVNDHLDVMDYAIAKAKERSIYILFTPITTYSSLFPDGRDSDELQGFSKFYKKSELGTNPDAIAAQCNYLRQILNHVNPYTGVALKDEPAILFVEMINEPSHHSDDFAGSVAYINALVDAVRGAGCKKILFHNVSQDFKITTAIKASQAQGASFAWYPTGLNARHALTENYLRSVDDFAPMLRPDLRNVPKAVYEFDSADMNSGYMYPAMIREFRGVGAQFIAMFSYDMLDTAPYNLGWQTHFLNLVYSPKKAMSAIIAAEATKALPRYRHYGDYPDNKTFGPFRVSYEEDLSEMVTNEKFLYANDTQTRPPKPAALIKIAGFGSSPVVAYAGRGVYFLDKIAGGLWRLEVYPDAVLVQDPFAQRLNYQDGFVAAGGPPVADDRSTAGFGRRVRTYCRSTPATLFPQKQKTESSRLIPAFMLSKNGQVQRAKLPKQIGHVKMDEFVARNRRSCPRRWCLRRARNIPPIGPSKSPQRWLTRISRGKSRSLYARQQMRTSKRSPCKPPVATPGAPHPGGHTAEGPADYFLTASIGDVTRRFPTENVEEFWPTSIVTPTSPTSVVQPRRNWFHRLARLSARGYGDSGARECSGTCRLRRNPAALRFFSR